MNSREDTCACPCVHVCALRMVSLDQFDIIIENSLLGLLADKTVGALTQFF